MAVRLAVAAAAGWRGPSTTRTDDDGLAALVERALAAAALRPADPDCRRVRPGRRRSPPSTTGTTPPPAPRPTTGRRPCVAVRGRRRRWPRRRGGRVLLDRGRATGRWLRRPASGRAPARPGGARRHPPVATGINRAGRRRPRRARRPTSTGRATRPPPASIDGAACGGGPRRPRRAAALDPVELPPGPLRGRARAAGGGRRAAVPRLRRVQRQGARGRHVVRPPGRGPVGRRGRHLGRRHRPPGRRRPLRRRGHAQAAAVDLVRAGVSVGLAHDRRSARLAGVEPTGHSVGAEALGGYPTDLFLAAGDRSPDELVAAVERGLLVTDLWYNRILDPKTQVVTGLTRNGLFLIEDGGWPAGAEPALHAVGRGGLRARAGCSAWATTPGSWSRARAASCTCRACAWPAGRSRGTPVADLGCHTPSLPFGPWQPPPFPTSGPPR